MSETNGNIAAIETEVSQISQDSQEAPSPKPKTKHNPLGQEYEITWNIDNVNYDNTEDYIRVKKMDPEFTFELWLEDTGYAEFEPDEFTPMSWIEEMWTKPAFTAAECIERFKENSEKLMIAFKVMGAEKMFEELGGVLIDEESIEKTKPVSRFENVDLSAGYVPEDALVTEEKTYTDTYKLYRVDKTKFGTTPLRNDVYLVECVCPSTDRHFYLFVDGTVDQCHTAFGAIAWTMRDSEGIPLTVEQWKQIEKEA